MADTARDIVVDYLTALQERGETRLPLDDSARVLLGTWLKAARNGTICPQSHGGESKTTEPAPAKPASVQVQEAKPLPTPPPTEQPLPPAAPEKVTPTLTVPEGSVEEKIAALSKQAENWVPATELGTLRDIMVFSTGNPHSPLMLIGEAPGYQEERQQEPFVGPAGEKLNQILKAMGMDRKDIYISNIVKFRPSLPNQTTNNRQPNDEEINACLPLILEEIRAIRPKAIVALGGTAAQGLLRQKASVNSLRGSFHSVENVPVRVTYHPSYLLRSESNRDKRLVWEDMLAVMEKLEMPISEKQRGYFLGK